MPADLFQPFQLGGLTLANRVVMAPMKRNRADAEGVATPLMAVYYQQRATAGLIISESTPVSADGVGYPFTPGHAGKADFVTPRALEAGEIQGIVAQYQHAAVMARRAGFDGVEVHAGNGYLVDQFLRDGTNRRTDAYGGSAAKRMRLLNEILDAVAAVWPARRIGVRLTPENSFNSMSDSDPQAHFGYFAEQLGRRGLAYLHVLEGDMTGNRATLDYRDLRWRYGGPYLANNAYDLARAQAAVRRGAVDMVAFGAPFVANPDLVRRYRENLPLNEADPSTYYTGGETGYTDYRPYAGVEAAVA